MEDFSEDRLIGKAKTGDVEAFSELVRRYQEKVYRMILSLTRNSLDADDLTQEAFLQAFRSLKGFKHQAGFYTWLYRIAINLTLNFLKKTAPERKRRIDMDPEVRIAPSSPGGPGKTGSPESDSLKRELRSRLQEAIAALPTGYRLAFVLVEFQGLNHRQASVVLRCSENTISWRMFRARKMLQARIKPYLEGGTT
jgi:RNA polymerase sigma-70 factor (ECF subfamily)